MTKKKKKRKKRVKNGELTQLANGHWQGRVAVGRTENGPMYQTITRESKEELEALVLYQRLLYARNKLTQRSKMTLEEWANIWIDEIKFCLIGEITYNSYRSYIDNHIIPILGKKTLLSLKKEDIERFVGKLQAKSKDKKPLTIPSLKAVFNVLNQMLKSAVNARLIVLNPAEDVTLPKATKKERVVLTSEQVKRFFDTILAYYPEWYDLYYMELLTGLRRGELMGIKWEDIDESRGVIQIKRGIKYIKNELIVTPTKTNSGKRVIVLAESLRTQLIERHKSISSEWVFPDFEDDEFPIMPTRATEILKKIMAQAELPYIPFHNLRHTFATQALASGIEPETISNILGHKYVSFTLDTYMHSTVDMQKNVSAYIRDLLLEYGGDNNG